MSLLSTFWRSLGPPVQTRFSLSDVGYVSMRGMNAPAIYVDADTALRHSAVWACLRLRANLVSSLPVDVYRRVGTKEVEAPPPVVLVTPDGVKQDIHEFLWASQFDLDRFGNVMGYQAAYNSFGLPTVIELWPTESVHVQCKGSKITGYRYGNTIFDPADVYHERQYVIPGYPVGLSPLTYAMWTVQAYLSAQKSSVDYYRSGGAPTGVLRNKARAELDLDEIDAAKRAWKTATQNRDIFVTANEWEWSPSDTTAATGIFLDQMRWGVSDVARFFDVPGDLIDAAQSGTSVTYANVTQRNVQLLTTSLGPAIARRERALTKLTPKPQYVKLNSDALLRMDPLAREQLFIEQVKGRIRAPSEVRALDNLAPFTPEQLDEFATLFPKGAPKASSSGDVAPILD